MADLTVSHHRSLQLMNQQKRELEELVRAAETRKTRITQRIHQVRGEERERDLSKLDV